MRFITSSILILSLLMPAIGCDAPAEGQAQSGAELTTIDDRGLMQTLHGVDRPYVLLSFYTTFCKPCVKEIPDLRALDQDAQSPVRVLFVSLDHGPSREHLPAFMDKTGLRHSYHLDADAAAAFFGANLPDWNQSVPQNLLFTREGRLVEHLQMTGAKEVVMLVHKDQSFH